MSDEVNWKDKCLLLEKTLKTLSGHCYKVVEKHEELLEKYKKNEEQFDLLVKKLEEREKELKEVQKLLEPACVEYECIKEKYEEAVQCQQEAESYASSITKEYKILQRKSQMVLSQSSKIIDIPDAAITSDVVDSVNEKYLKEKTDEITRLNEEKATLNSQLKKAQEDLLIEQHNCKQAIKKEKIARSELQQMQHSLNQHIQAIQQLSKVSEAAFKEYEALKSEYELEAECRNKAENFASKLFKENTAIKRQSSVLLQSVSSDTRLMKALAEVEDLTASLETVKIDYQKQVKQLEEELAELKDNSQLISLEKEHCELSEDREQLQKQLIELREQYNSLESQYQSLQTQCADVQRKYDDAIKPPPPPPPPPLSSGLRNIGILGRFQKKKKKTEIVKKTLAVGGAQVSEGYSKALEEMMKRIKEGKPLTKVLRPTQVNKSDQSKECGAMEELHTILNKMKRTRSDPDLLAPIEKEHESSELTAAFRKIRGDGDGSSNSNVSIKDDDTVFTSKSCPVAKPRLKTLSAVQEEPPDDSQ